MNPFDPSRLEPAPASLPTGADKRPPRHGPGEKFLKGPIPWRWLELASALPGKALAVGLAIWKEAGCRNERTVPLNLSNQRMPRRTAQRALQELAKAGLVSVEHREGRPTLVTLNDQPGTERHRMTYFGALNGGKMQNDRFPPRSRGSGRSAGNSRLFELRR